MYTVKSVTQAEDRRNDWIDDWLLISLLNDEKGNI